MPNKKREEEESGSESSSEEEQEPLISLNRSNVSGTKPAASTRGPPTKKQKTDQKKEKEEIIDIEFAIYDPVSTDFYSVKHLVRHLTEDVSFDASGLANIISEQVVVGGMVKTGVDESPIAVISALNLRHYHEEKCIKQIKKYLLSKCQDQKHRSDLTDLYNGANNSRLGLIINERVVNLPGQLVPPLHQSLQADIVWAQENDDTQELKDSFKFTHFAVLCPLFQDNSEDQKDSKVEVPKPKTKGGKKNKKRKAVEQVVLTQPNEMFLKYEDECYVKHAEWAVRFDAAPPLEERASAIMQACKGRMLAIVNARKLPAILAEIQQVSIKLLLEESEA